MYQVISADEIEFDLSYSNFSIFSHMRKVDIIEFRVLDVSTYNCNRGSTVFQFGYSERMNYFNVEAQRKRLFEWRVQVLAWK